MTNFDLPSEIINVTSQYLAYYTCDEKTGPWKEKDNGQEQHHAEH